MLTLHVALTELKRILRNRMLRATLIVVCIVPILYGVLYLWAFWDPYGNLNKLPVAVVNMDKGGLDEGKNLNFGDDLIKELRKNKVFDWDFIKDPQAADRGLRNKKYYVSIKVPADFTQKVLSVKGDRPDPAKLEVVTNEGKNMLAGQIAGRVLLEINSELNKKVTKKYLDNIFTQTKESTVKLADAISGTEKMLDGNNKLLAGSQNLSDGLAKISTGLTNLKLGSDNLHSGSGQLVDGLSQTSSGSAQLAKGLAAAPPSLKILSNGITSAKNSVDTMAVGANGVKIGLDGVNSLVKGASAKIDAGDYNGAKAMLDQINTMLNYQLDAHNPGIITIQSSISNGLQSGASGGNNLSDSLKKLLDGENAVNTQLTTAAVSAKLLADGNSKALDGARQIYSGLGVAAKGTGELQIGAQAAYDGTNRISGGETDLTKGLNELRNGLKTEQDIKIPNDQALQVMAKPVDMEKTGLFKVPNYGTGFSPYFIPLSLWVGALVLFFLVGLKENRLAISPLGNYPVVLGKFLTLAFIGIVQSLILSLVLRYALNLQVANPLEFYMVNIVLSLCFISIIQLLVGTLGQAGRFVAVVLLMLQLTSSAGTYPKETLPVFFQTISPWLPMTYGVAALRDVISGNSGSSLGTNVLVIVTFTIGALALSMITSKRWFTLNDLKPVEEI